jgi:hypothetical protein
MRVIDGGHNIPENVITLNPQGFLLVLYYMIIMDYCCHLLCL